jgi:hypothetical protein
MENESRLSAEEVLASASAQYERYLNLARLTDLSGGLEEGGFAAPAPAPMGLVLDGN